MGTFTVERILKATGGRLIFGSPDAVFTGVAIDSRAVKRGELFVALRGQRFDGHSFLIDALQEGGGALVSSPPLEPIKGRTIIYVKNTLKALQQFANHLRKESGALVLGVTGTNGKTTTKELLASILGRNNSVLKTGGNLNNQIGLPLTMTGLTTDHRYAVLEMGASIRGDIRELCGIAEPDAGIITNIGMGHLEGFGTMESVRDTKLELLDAVKTIAVNADDAYLMEGVAARRSAGRTARVITFGTTRGADVSARDIVLRERSSRFVLQAGAAGETTVNLALPGRFNVLNALAAAAISSACGIGLEDIRDGIEAFRGVPMRLEVKEVLGATVISDVYNANPASTEEAVRELTRMRKSRAVAVLGDMLELGVFAEEAHRRLGGWMAGIAVDVFVAVGPLMAMAAEEFRSSGRETVSVPDSVAAGKMLGRICREGDTVLVKGSRGTRMERVLEEAAAAQGETHAV